MRRSKLLLVVAGGIAFFAVAISVFQFVAKPALIRSFISKAPPPVTTVATAVAATESWVPRLAAIGTFRAVQGIDIAPQAAGIVRAINFESGGDVAAGKVLVEIDDALEQSDLKSNIAALRNAELALERQQQLMAGGSTTRASFDQAQANRDQTAAAVERTRALIEQKAIKAPFAGRLGLRKIDVGQYVTPGTGLVTLQQLNPMYIDFTIPEQSFALLRVGQMLELSVDAYAGKVFQGKIASIDARVSAETRNVLVRATVENPEKLLRPGMFANIAVLAGETQSVVTLPRTAVTFSLYGDAVFVVKPLVVDENSAPPPADVMTVERRFVRTGDVRGEFVAITEGVAAGDQVVSEGQLKLLPSSRVRVDNSNALQPLPTLPKQ